MRTLRQVLFVGGALLALLALLVVAVIVLAFDARFWLGRPRGTA